MTLDQSRKDVGEIITFYSYKGGTGRTMSLTNAACLMARRLIENEKILMIDWDMEAPGLHCYFRGHILYEKYGYGGAAEAISKHPGLIELFSFLRDSIELPDCDRTNFEPTDEQQLERLISELDIESFVLETDIKGLYLLKAGRLNSDYSKKVNQFNWFEFFDLAPSLFTLLAEKLADNYKYVLIDSRTGVTDTSGICTTLMPDKLVAVFTPNHQSLAGVLNTVEKAASYRLQSDDLRPLSIFPLPSRVEDSEVELKEIWRFGSSNGVLPSSFSEHHEFIGYQQQFQELFKQVYRLEKCSLKNYFDEIQIQHSPRYSYGEEIAVVKDKDADRLSLSQSYKVFSDHLLLKYARPWEYKKSGSSRVFDEAIFDGESDHRKFDVFLCHNSRDKSTVLEIGKQLKQRGLNPWIDIWNLRPGESWQRSLEQQIEDIEAVAIFVGEEGSAPWQSEEIYAFLHEFVRRQRPVIPVILPNAPEILALPLFLKNRQWIDLRLQQQNPIDQLVWGITGTRPESQRITYTD